MAIIAREPESKFTNAPEGLHQAVCVDVDDVGIQKTPWGEKHKVVLVWQLDLVNEETGKRFDIRKFYTLSLSEKATLRKDLECWRGRKFTPEELEGFDLERLLGANCQLQVAHNLSDEGKTYANVQAIVPFSSKLGPTIRPLDYVRKKDRARQTGEPPAHGDEDAPPF